MTKFNWATLFLFGLVVLIPVLSSDAKKVEAVDCRQNNFFALRLLIDSYLPELKYSEAYKNMCSKS
ncbi:hypothetical protein [Candidatus Odyssella thessalonicensis]|uniref:hypothetical protein n=1 Tax=Candidatus Odyssella thessalonicensis TaxID=84647 RepID=UPI000225A9F0|nr:hypothetical protein [Candidatus Odyssella thessalonicensis]